MSCWGAKTSTSIKRSQKHIINPILPRSAFTPALPLCYWRCSKFKYWVSPQKNPLIKEHRANTLYIPHKVRRLFHSSRNIHLTVSPSSAAALVIDLLYYFCAVLSLLHLNMSFIFLEVFFPPACISPVTLFFISLLYSSSVKRVLCSLIFIFLFLFSKYFLSHL